MTGRGTLVPPRSPAPPTHAARVTASDPGGGRGCVTMTSRQGGGRVVTADNAQPVIEPAVRDAELHGRLVAGDERALGEIYALFGSLMHALALRVTRDRDAASDVVQEVFGHLWE